MWFLSEFRGNFRSRFFWNKPDNLQRFGLIWHGCLFFVYDTTTGIETDPHWGFINSLRFIPKLVRKRSLHYARQNLQPIVWVRPKWGHASFLCYFNFVKQSKRIDVADSVE